MKASIKTKLDTLRERFEEVGLLLSQPDAAQDQDSFRRLSMEYAQLEPVVKTLDEFTASSQAIADAQELLDEDDPELRKLAQDELDAARSRAESLEDQLQILLLPKDPRDDSNIFLEVRAGTGGDEAALFAGDLFRMYLRYAESLGWKVEILKQNEGDHGGFKEVISRIEGQGAYSKLKFESGAHRVQRVPETESQGRIHTSACTVAVMAEQDDVIEVEIKPEDLRIDTYRSSGAGGQHVNTTDSAIRITHLPTGVVVECQDERSQHKNKARALSLLKSRLLDEELARQQAEQSQERRNLVGSGDRSQRIRTYNFPDRRVTDHRINLTIHKLSEILSGDLNPIVSALTQEHQADQLAAMAGDADPN